MFLQNFIEQLKATDRQLEEVLLNRLKFEPQGKIKFDFSIVISAELKIQYISSMGLRLLGLKSSVLDGVGEYMQLASDNFEEIKKKTKLIISTKNVENSNYVGSLKISEYFFDYFISPVYTASGEIQAVMCTFTDITDKKQEIMNQYLTENGKLAQLIDLCPLGIVLYDKQGNVIELNRAHSERIAKLDREKFLGRPGGELLEALGLTWKNSPCSRALQGIETVDGYSKSKYGKRYLVNAIPLRDYQNAIIGGMTIIHDITEYEILKEEITKLDRLNLVGEMAAGVAHEIRNPMTVIKGYLQYLSKSVPSNIMEQFNLVLGELEQIETIITDFLSLAGNKRVETKEQNLNDIIKGIIPLISTDTQKGGIDLKVNLAENLPNLILNEREIKQLILNLARNGIESIEKHGTLMIESIFNNGIISLCVEDNGCGISAGNQERIFDPFFTTKETGTGLGLSVCAGIARRNNGIINIQSEQGKGTRVTVNFISVCV